MDKRIFFGLVICASWLAWSASASAAPESIKIYTFSSYLKCDDTCAATIYGGPLAEINLTIGKTQSWFLGGTLSRVLIEFDRYATIEGEIGIGKRFGQLRETEAWNGYTFRWSYFPWNRYIMTTIALTAGVSYASGIATYEVRQSVVGHGSRLLGFFSPEVTLALPSAPNWQLVARVHHRSGGGIVWRDKGLFNGVWGASQYFVLGIRHWF